MEIVKAIKAEIERRKNNNLISAKKCPTSYFSLVVNEDIEILDFINSLPEDEPSEDLEKAAEEYEHNLGYYECMNQWPSVAFKAGAQWQKEQQPASGSSEKPNNQEDLEKEREGLSPTMLTYAADVFGGKILIEDISYSYRQELASYFRDLAKMAREEEK